MDVVHVLDKNVDAVEYVTHAVRNSVAVVYRLREGEPLVARLLALTT